MRKNRKVKIFVLVAWSLAAFLSLASWALWNVVIIPPFFASLMMVAAPFFLWMAILLVRDEREENIPDKAP